MPISKIAITPREMVAALLMMVMLGLLFVEHNRAFGRELLATSFPEDQPYVDRAMTLWAKENNEPRSETVRKRFAMALQFRSETCVALELKVRAAGGVPIYCFDTKSGQLSRVDLSHAD